MKKSLFLLCAGLTLLHAQDYERPLKANVNEKPYPYNNPVITHMYTADAAPHVMPDGRVWMVTSVDLEEGGGYSTMHSYHTFSSADMVNWTDHGEILHINDLIGGEEPEFEDWALWAPDMIYRHGTYYLYFPLRIVITDTSKPADERNHVVSYIAVAESDAPDQRFRVVNPKIEGTRGIDPAVFIDDDDTPYLYFGPHLAARLKDNMTELAEESVQLDMGTDNFMEAIWMHKRAGKYYVNYHTKYNWRIDLNAETIADPERARSDLAWSVGDSPMGPFTYGGILNFEPGVGVKNGPVSPEGDFVPWRLTLSNHGGVVEYHGQDYLFYHTSALSSWRQDAFEGRGTWTQRSVCIDLLNYNADGSVIPVKQTIESVPAVTINQPFEIKLNPKKAKSKDLKVSKESVRLEKGTGTLRFKNVELGTGYYYFDVSVLKSTGAGTIEIRLDAADGPLAGTISLTPESTERNNGVAETFLRAARGVRDVVVVIRGEGTVRIADPRFFAGAPLKSDE